MNRKIIFKCVDFADSEYRSFEMMNDLLTVLQPAEALVLPLHIKLLVDMDPTAATVEAH